MYGELKNKILQLRGEGKTYDEIQSTLKCSKGTIAYYCGVGQKLKTENRRKKLRAKHPYISKCHTFLYSRQRYGRTNSKYIKTIQRIIYEKIHEFCDGDNMFTYDDVINKFGQNPKCYITGEEIDISKSRSYAFDYIIPKSRGGDNSIDNLGICTTTANQAKHTMTPDELYFFCKKVLEHQGYNVSKVGPEGNDPSTAI